MEKFITKHTPGPWSINPIASDDWRSLKVTGKTDALEAFSYQDAWIKNSDGNILAAVKALDAAWFIRPVDNQFEANAYLISAAPLLLSALIKAVEDHESLAEWFNAHKSNMQTEYPVPDWVNEAKAALAAAGVVVEESKPEN